MQKNYIFYLSILLISSCSPTPHEEAGPHEMADYFIRFLEAEQQFKAQASFSEGDTPQSARPLEMSEVTFQGRAMEKRELPGYGTRYDATFNGTYGDGLFRFTYRGEKGRAQEHRIQMTPVAGFSISGQVSKTKGMTLTVHGGLLGPYEELVLLFTDAQNRAASITIPGPANDSTFTFLPAQLAGLTTGPGRLYLVKKRTEILERPTKTTTTAVEYYTAVRELEVVGGQ